MSARFESSFTAGKKAPEFRRNTLAISSAKFSLSSVLANSAKHSTEKSISTSLTCYEFRINIGTGIHIYVSNSPKMEISSCTSIHGFANNCKKVCALCARVRAPVRTLNFNSLKTQINTRASSSVQKKQSKLNLILLLFLLHISCWCCIGNVVAGHGL